MKWDTALTSLTIVSVLPLGWALFGNLTAFTVIASGVIAVLGFTGALMTRPPSRIYWRGLTSDAGRERRRPALVAGVMLGLPMGLLMGFFEGPWQGLIVFLFVGLLGGLQAGLLSGMITTPDSVSRPGDVLRADARCGIMTGVVSASGIGTLGVLTEGLSAGIVVGCASGLLFGLVGGTNGLSERPTGAAASRRYLVFLLCARHEPGLPFRLNAFLTWAYEANLLRLAGSAYQFRHREIQRWLAANP